MKNYIVQDKLLQLAIDFSLFLLLFISEYLSIGITEAVISTAIILSDVFILSNSLTTAEGLTELFKALTGFTIFATAVYRLYDLIKTKNKNKDNDGN